MPYIREGKCVYKENSDKTKGKLKGCSETVEMAKKYMRALYAAENKSLAEFSMVITKASIPDKASRNMRLAMVTSDTGEDVFEERMSQELFDDFVERIENNEPVPAPFDEVIEDGWDGGMPYLSISHYKSGAGKNVPGMPEKIYRDGERLKSTALLYDSPLGQGVWKSVCTDLEERSKPIEERSFKNPVRISIGFLDLQHKHVIDGEEDYIFTRSELGQKCEKCEDGINGKVYLKGQLVHLAFTRVPANPRTQVEVYRMGEEIETKKEDAESIVGELAEELVGKSVVEDDVLVVKADEESRDEDEMEVEEMDKREDVSPADKKRAEKKYGNVTYADAKNKKYPVDTEEHIRAAWNYIHQKRNAAKYSAEEVSAIKKKIVAAWKRVIGGTPPSAQQSKSEAIMDEQEVLEQEPVVEEEQVEEEKVVEAPVEEPTELEKSAVAVVTKLKELSINGTYGNAALQEVQPLYAQFGEVIKKSVAAPLGAIDEDALATKVAEKLMPQIAEMVAKAIPTAAPTQAAQNANTFTSRSLTNLNQNQPAVSAEGGRKLTQIEKIAYRNSGLKVD